MKQIALGFIQYTQDYDESYPKAYDYNGGGYLSPATGWAAKVQPYLKSVQIFQCPSEPTQGNSDPTSVAYSDYFYNWYLGGEGAAVTREPSLTQSSLTVLAGDGLSWSAVNRSYGCVNRGSTPPVTTPDVGGGACPANAKAECAVGVATRHLDGQLFAFADGHVKWYNGTRVDDNVSRSDRVWNAATTGAVSGNDPTFNVIVN